MGRTSIILPTSGTVDLYDDVQVSYNYNAADIREPEKGVADYTKTIIVPGTKNNNKLFHHQFDINIDSVWDTRKKLSCTVLVDDVEILKGYMRLMRIIHKGLNEIEYEVTIIGNSASIFKDVGGDELSVIPMSMYDHTYNKTNIVASWTAPVGSGYVYPCIDHGNYDVNELALDVKHFLPTVYVKEYWDKIFARYGYQYQSTFLNSDFFKRLIIPFNSDQLKYTASEIASREFRVSRELTSQTAVLALTVATLVRTEVDFNDDSTSPNINPSGIFNLGTDRFTVASGKSGYYIFHSLLNLNVTAGQITAADAYIKVYNPDGTVKSTSSAGSGNYNAQNVTILVGMQSILLDVGDYVKVEVSALGEGTSEYYINPSSWFRGRVNNIIIQPGDPMVMTSVIPDKVKISDFLSGIKKMFNLYFSIDKDISNKYIIEPRDDWYSSGVVDWSSKLDYSNDLETLPMGELDSKRYIFQYTKDEDYYNSLYQDKYQEQYGSYKKVIDTDFVKNDYEIQPIFSASPLHSSTQHERVFVKLRKKDGTSPALFQKTNIRILYYGGLKSCADTPWEFPKGTGLLTTYPFAGHIDDPIAPSIDLSYGIPKEVYYLAIQLDASYTNNNLYNVYWRSLIEEIADKNSRIVIAYFYLTTVDINQLDVRKVYYFKGNYWRLNKIMDYNPLHDGPTKCEFTKIKTSRTGFN